MRQANEIKFRECKVCSIKYKMTAKEIKEHAEKCQKEKDKLNG